MKEYAIHLGFAAIGWACGFIACWLHFSRNRLIRTREEWERAREKGER